MKYLFKNFLKNKYFLIWILFFFFVLYFIFSPLIGAKTEYMDKQNITDIIYLFYVFVSPLSFAQMSFTSCFVLDICYLSILLYIVINFINYFFVDSVSTTLTRVKREKWIKSIVKVNFVFSIVLSISYILFFLFLCLINGYNIDLNISCFILIGYKILITLIIPLIYLLLYLLVKNPFISLNFSCLMYVLLEILIGFTLIETSLTFKYVLLVYLLLGIIYISIITCIYKIFKRSDV